MTVEPPEGDGKTHRADHRGHLAEPGPRLQHPPPGQAAAAHRQADVRRRPRAVRPLHPRRRRRHDSPRSCQRSLRESFAETMRILRDPDFQQLLIDYPRASRDLHRRARRHRHGRLRVADQGRHRQGVQARRLPAGCSLSSSASTQDQVEALQILLSRPAGVGRRAADASCARRSPRRPSTSPRPTSSGPSSAAHHKALVDIISMVKHAAVDDLAAADRRGAGQRRPSTKVIGEPRS